MEEDERIWGPDENSEWGLFTNLSAELVISKPPEVKTDKKPLKPKSAIENPAFYFTKTKTDNKGGVILTPQGYGIIQDIKSEGKVLSVKVNNVIQDYKKTDLDYEIPLNITFYSGSTKYEAIIHFPIHMTIAELLGRIEGIEIGDDRVCSVRVFYNGNELVSSQTTIEKQGIQAEGKLLVIMAMGKPMKISRFTSKTSGWSYNSNYVDGITFSVNKNIRFTGYGLYVPSIDSALKGTAKFIEGGDAKGKLLASKEVSLLQKGPEVVDMVQKVIFDRPIQLKAGEKYSCVSDLRVGTSWYGNGGKASVTGEKDVVFTFVACTGSVNGTGPSSGQFPEFYYYA